MSGAPELHAARRQQALTAALARNGIVCAILLSLLGAMLGVACLPLGRWTFVFNIGLALVQAGLVGIVSMGLDRTTNLNRLAAVSGGLFLLVMFAFTLGDLFTRL